MGGSDKKEEKFVLTNFSSFFVVIPTDKIRKNAYDKCIEEKI